MKRHRRRRVIQAPVATHTFKFDPATDDVVGELQVTKVEGEDTSRTSRVASISVTKSWCG